MFFFFQAEDGIRDKLVTGVQTCALPILRDGTGYAAAIAGADRARNGYVRLRVADPAGAQWDRVREFWHAQSEERRVRARQKSNRARLRLRGLPGVHARLHPSSYQS